MERAEDLKKIRRETTRGAFQKRFPHLWLLREVDPNERASPLFDTNASDMRKTLTPGQRLKRANPELAARLRTAPDRLGLYPIVKTQANPWRDRIMVGRASNNDLVLRHESVSKVHAYFQRGHSQEWRLHDAKSVNGTQVDGRLVPRGGDGVEVKSGSVLMFGNLQCEIIDSGELFDAL